MKKTKKLFSKQKQAIKIIPMLDIHANLNCDEKMKHLDILNIYKRNLYQILNIVFRVRTNSIPETLQNKFKIIEHNYSTRFILQIFILQRFILQIFYNYSTKLSKIYPWNHLIKVT